MSRQRALVPSAPIPTDEQYGGYEIFERVRTPDVGVRRCAPTHGVSFVAVDRVVADGRLALLLRRHHHCHASWNIAGDAFDPALGAVGMHLIDAFSDDDGNINVVIDGCPGVRLRALAEACAARGRTIPREVVWHVVRWTRAQQDVWARAGVKPGDTFVGFDGSLHFFPCFEGCASGEAPSYTGHEVWDSLIVDGSPDSLAQLMTASLPPPFFGLLLEAARREAGRPALTPIPIPPIPQVVHDLLAQPPTPADARGGLAALARELFPDVFDRHQRLYAQLGTSIEHDGFLRQELVLTANAADWPTALRVVGPEHRASGMPWGRVPHARFAIETGPVRAGQLRRFLRATGGDASFLDGARDAAVAVRVPHEIAAAYARWIGRRLPTGREWSRVADDGGFRCVFDIR